jgi:predicted alpha/beta superfamily hydrolase
MSAPPAPASEVLKLSFSGTLGERPLYIYLPPGYNDPDAQRMSYPVLYLHDGQNCFEAFSGDAFGETWRADETADALITAGEVWPLIIVGVGNGGEKRLEEYLPPYSRLPIGPRRRLRHGLRRTRHLRGRAHRLYTDYREVARFVEAHYRVLRGREHSATCGSSLGGLFSAYLALEHPEFARHHGVLSASFWATGRGGKLQMLERWQRLPVQDVRLWLDSGTGAGDSDDNRAVTLAAREALLAAGYEEGEHFVYHLAEARRTPRPRGRALSGGAALFSPARSGRRGDTVRRRYERLYSPALGREVELLAFGHYGAPLVAFPTGGGGFTTSRKTA